MGITQLGPWQFDTTGVLGWSKADGQFQPRGWPEWLTIPGFQDLADARHWHFLFAWILVFNGLAYLTYSLWSRHLQRDIWPSRCKAASASAPALCSNSSRSSITTTT